MSSITKKLEELGFKADRKTAEGREYIGKGKLFTDCDKPGVWFPIFTYKMGNIHGDHIFYLGWRHQDGDYFQVAMDIVWTDDGVTPALKRMLADEDVPY